LAATGDNREEQEGFLEEEALLLLGSWRVVYVHFQTSPTAAPKTTQGPQAKWFLSTG
jgi:hypothetical protein